MPRKLLVVDDDADMRELLRHLLALRGHTVITATLGREALAAAAGQHLDGALIDINLPDTNGVDLCQALSLQARVLGRVMPHWIMTGAFRPSTNDSARAAGALGVFRKPLKVAELCKSFERAVEAYYERPTDESAVSA